MAESEKPSEFVRGADNQVTTVLKLPSQDYVFNSGWAVLDTLGSLISSFLHSFKKMELISSVYRTCIPRVANYMEVLVYFRETKIHALIMH